MNMVDFLMQRPGATPLGGNPYSDFLGKTLAQASDFHRQYGRGGQFDALTQSGPSAAPAPAPAPVAAAQAPRPSPSLYQRGYGEESVRAPNLDSRLVPNKI